MGPCFISADVQLHNIKIHWCSINNLKSKPIFWNSGFLGKEGPAWKTFTVKIAVLRRFTVNFHLLSSRSGNFRETEISHQKKKKGQSFTNLTFHYDFHRRMGIVFPKSSIYQLYNFGFRNGAKRRTNMISDIFKLDL